MDAADDDYRLAAVRREHRQRAVLHLRHDRTPEGRSVQPSLDLAARLCHRAAGCAGIKATSRVLPVVPMFHVNAWGMPYAAALTGAALVLPGRHLDGASMATILNDENVTFTAGVPTVWLGLLQYLRTSGERLTTVKRIMTGGSAAPPLLIEAFRDEYGVRSSTAGA